MMPYVLTTVISTLLVYLEEKLPLKLRKKRILSFLSMILLCFLAGARDVTVGTDTSLYGENLFNWISNHDFMGAMFMSAKISMEIGYVIFLYLVSRITDFVFWDYFFMEFVCVYFTYKALDDAEIGKYKWVGVFLFNTLFYSFTLNLMRQYMAMSIVLYGFKYVRQSRFWKYLIFCLIASLIHSSALIGITVYFFYKMCGLGDTNKRDSLRRLFKKYRKVIAAACVVGAFFVVLFAKQLITIVVKITSSYETQSNWIQSYSPAVGIFIVMFLLVLPMIIYRVWRFKDKQQFLFYFLMMTISVILWQLTGVSSQTYRITLYYWYLIILIVPELICALKYIKNRNFVIAYYMVCGSFYYWFMFIYSLVNETYPYTSSFLGIR